MMNDIESIIIYGFAGHVIISDFFLLVFGIYQKLNGLSLGAFRQRDSILLARKVFGILAGLALIFVYRSELLGFFWSFIFFLALTTPEQLWLIYKDTKMRKIEEREKQQQEKEHEGNALS